jgi:hypothetical protein
MSKKFKKICDLNRGERVLLNYGDQNGDIATCHTFDRYIRLLLTSSFKAWEATVMMKPRGKDPIVVYLKVHGWAEDLGDTYAHQIIGWFDDTSGTFEPIEHTAKQKQMEATAAAMFWL